MSTQAPSAPAQKAGGKNFNRAQVVDENFVRFVQEWSGAPARRVERHEAVSPDGTLSAADAIELFESQLVARRQDLESREMRTRNESFYTIGSTGHEGNAVLGRASRHTDMAFLHYRSGGFMAERSRKVPGIDFTRDTMLSFAASAHDPISGGRHKVWGSRPLWVPPQTSTIASHLPKAVGAALALGRSKELGLMPELPEDSIVICTFGDASANHATAQTAFNAAGWHAYQGIPVPILFLCEDNGIGISVRTPEDWIESSIADRPGFAYHQIDGLDLVDAWEGARESVEYCRTKRVPVFLHMKCVRLLGHAGTDVEMGYRTWEEIEAGEARDPILSTARWIMESGIMAREEVLALHDDVKARVKAAAAAAIKTPKLTSPAEIIAPLAPYTPDAVAAEAKRSVPHAERLAHFGGEAKLPENLGPGDLSQLINRGLQDLLLKYPEIRIFGEDVGRKGGVYHVTVGLQQKFGIERVYDTLLDETTILGLAIGAGHMGQLPFPEIQYLAYYHNAEDQIRGEACSLQYFSKDQFRNPMVVRLQGWGYQKGFGGHFHNDNSIAALRDVPGLVIATPSRGDDAVGMLRTMAAMAKVDGRVCIFIEPIALYKTTDLYEAKDGLWHFACPGPGEAVPFGEGRVYHADAKDLVIFTFSNGVHMSLRAAKTLKEKHNIAARVIDLRWLNPLNEDFIAEQAQAAGRVLVVDESRRAGGVAEAILSIIHERCRDIPAERLNAMDVYVPLGPAANIVIPTENDVAEAARKVAGR